MVLSLLVLLYIVSARRLKNGEIRGGIGDLVKNFFRS